jgi:hypothetical protein
MEGSVNSEMHKKSDKSARPRKVEFSNGADAMGLWFAAIILCAVLTAGVIIYRAGDSDIMTASNEVTMAGAPGNAR